MRLSLAPRDPKPPTQVFGLFGKNLHPTNRPKSTEFGPEVHRASIELPGSMDQAEGAHFNHDHLHKGFGGLVQINFQTLAGIVPFRIQATTKLRATSRMI